MNTKAIIERFPDSGHLFPLGDGIGGHKSGSDACPFHKLCRFEIPAGHVVDFSRRLIGLALLIYIDGENIVLLLFALKGVANERRIAYDVIQFVFWYNALPILPQGIGLGDVGVGFQR